MIRDDVGQRRAHLVEPRHRTAHSQKGRPRMSWTEDEYNLLLRRQADRAGTPERKRRARKTITESVIGQDPPPLDITESKFQTRVMAVARVAGWVWRYHTHDSRRSESGMPDLLLLRDGDMIFAELKTETGPVAQVQYDVLELIRSNGVDAYLWRPSDWPAIVDRLTAAAAP